MLGQSSEDLVSQGDVDVTCAVPPLLRAREMAVVHFFLQDRYSQWRMHI